MIRRKGGSGVCKVSPSILENILPVKASDIISDILYLSSKWTLRNDIYGFLYSLNGVLKQIILIRNNVKLLA